MKMEMKDVRIHEKFDKVGRNAACEDLNGLAVLQAHFGPAHEDDAVAMSLI
ncbi:hypothetical protein FRB95_008463 [Tulasnella sp. JGI-2019a]|nr:hypothetical protein FRB95_008463 [Tulasnella sp. JGI-2019a]